MLSYKLFSCKTYFLFKSPFLVFPIRIYEASLENSYLCTPLAKRKVDR